MDDEITSKSLQNLRDIVSLCKRNGILRFEGAGFKLDFTTEAVARPIKKGEAPAATPTKISFDDVCASLGISPEEE